MSESEKSGIEGQPARASRIAGLLVLGLAGCAVVGNDEPSASSAAHLEEGTCEGVLCSGVAVTAATGETVCGDDAMSWTCTGAGWAPVGTPCVCGGGAPNGLPVVPGAFGFGMDTRAAYGGPVPPVVYKVTQLDDGGPGSLRAALEATEPRVVVFETSGTITLGGPIYVRSPYLTVAGQTAPAPGILVRGGGSDVTIEIWSHDVLFQHFRVRPGDDGCNSALGAWYYDGGPYNIVFDHMSVSWGQDENLYVGGHPDRPVNMTLWRSIAAEGLFRAAGSEQCAGGGTSNGHGFLVYEGSKNIAVLQNLFAHNLERNPYPQGDTSTYVANNLMYGTHEGAFFGNSTITVRPTFGTVVGNYFRRSSIPTGDFADCAVCTRALIPGSQLFLADNALDDGPAPAPWVPFGIIADEGIDPRVDTPPVTVPGYTPMPSRDVFDFVLAHAGARPAQRDAVDARIVEQARERTGDYISSPSQVGGYPDLAVNYRALTPPDQPHADGGDGYTNLEAWLHRFASEVGD